MPATGEQILWLAMVGVWVAVVVNYWLGTQLRGRVSPYMLLFGFLVTLQRLAAAFRAREAEIALVVAGCLTVAAMTVSFVRSRLRTPN